MFLVAPAVQFLAPWVNLKTSLGLCFLSVHGSSSWNCYLQHPPQNNNRTSSSSLKVRPAIFNPHTSHTWSPWFAPTPWNPLVCNPSTCEEMKRQVSLTNHISGQQIPVYQETYSPYLSSCSSLLCSCDSQMVNKHLPLQSAVWSQSLSKNSGYLDLY